MLLKICFKSLGCIVVEAKLAVGHEFLDDAGVTVIQDLCAAGVTNEFIRPLDHPVLFAGL